MVSTTEALGMVETKGLVGSIEAADDRSGGESRLIFSLKRLSILLFKILLSPSIVLQVPGCSHVLESVLPKSFI